MGSVSTAADRRRRGSLLTGLLLVALGVLLLLTTTGVVSFGIWLELADYWPLLVILIGVELILVQRPLLIRAGVIVLTLGGAIVAASFSLPEYDPNEPLRATYVESLRDTETLYLDMAFIGGDVELTSDTPGAATLPRLLAADFKSRPARVVREQLDGNVRFYVMSSGPFLRHSSANGFTRHETRVSFPVGLADWSLIVSPNVEVEINISSVAVDLDLDLRNLNVRRLSVEAGMSDLRVQLPDDAGQTHVDIAAGAANVELVVPRGVAARIDVDAPLKSTWINPVRFVEADNEFWSPGYLEARNRVSIDIEALSVDVTVR